MNFDNIKLSPFVTDEGNARTYQPQNVQADSGFSSAPTGFQLTDFTTAEVESVLGDGNTVPTQPPANLNQWEPLPLLCEPTMLPSYNLQRSDNFQHNMEIQNTNVLDELGMLIEVCKSQNDSNMSNVTSEESRSPEVHRYYDSVYHPEVGDNAEKFIMGLSSSPLILPRCPTPFGNGSAGSSPRSEGFELNNVERAIPRYQDPRTFCDVPLSQSVPQMLGVHNNQNSGYDSMPGNINIYPPPPPYCFPHDIETLNRRVPTRAPPPYSTINRNKVQRKVAASLSNIVQTYDSASHETETQRLIRHFGQQSAADKKTQLWQFLLQLLGDKRNSDIICWTGMNGEFRLVNHEAVAKRWGQTKGKPNMNYDRMSRALRYYYGRKMVIKNRSKNFEYQFRIEGILSELLTPRVSDSEFIQPSLE